MGSILWREGGCVLLSLDRQEILNEENRELKSEDPEYQRWLFRMGGPH